jgi:hypothetical protein
MLRCILVGQQSLFGGESPVLIADGKSPAQVAWPCATASSTPREAESFLTIDRPSSDLTCPMTPSS